MRYERVAWEGLFEKATFEQRFEGMKGASLADSSEKNVLDMNSKCKGPEARGILASVANRLSATVAGTGLGNHCSSQGGR